MKHRSIELVCQIYDISLPAFPILTLIVHVYLAHSYALGITYISGTLEPVWQVWRLLDQNLSQNGTQVHAHLCATRISAGPSEIVCYSKCSAQCTGSCVTVIVCLPKHCLWSAIRRSEALKFKIFLGEHAPRTPSRRCTSYVSFLCLLDQ